MRRRRREAVAEMREPTFTCALVAMLLLGSVLGCKSGPAAGKLGADLDPEIVAKWKPGMSEDDVLDLLGPPTQETGLADRRHMWTYRFVRVKKGDRITYRAVPPEMANRYHGSVFVIFDGKGRVMNVDGGENPSR